jgi:acetylornithine deacetylase/succinyl-diaminopimelate desuccinylase-like protein
LLLLFVLAACEQQPAQPPVTEPATEVAVATQQFPAGEIRRPTWDITTEEAFDASVIPAHAGDHAAVYAHIDANLEAHLAELQRWLRQPSVSAENFGVREMAEMARADFEALGFQEAELVETDGHPGVWGYYDAGADTTLMVYMMYDVQPVNPEDWQSPPFEAKVVEHELGMVLMARGATNQKGPERAFLNALQSIIAVDGKLPVNLMITAEGEEELGSPHYPQIIDAYEERLKTADGAIFPRTGQARDGRTTMTLGNKGIVYFEAESRGGDWGGPAQAEIHGSFKAITDSPVWRLLQGLSSLTSEDGNTVLVPGFYDDVRPPTLEEQRLINGYAKEWNDELMQQSYAVSQWIEGKTGREALLDLIYSPTLNIDGIWAGYTGEGVKTILPHKATAKLDARLPMGMDPEATLARIREHLAGQGFADIKLTKLAGYPASQTSVDTALARAVISVLAKYGSPPTVNPRTAGSAPFYLFTQRLGLPMVPMGLGYGTGAHAPNEILLVEPAEGVPIAGLADIEKSYADLLYALAAEKDH